MRQFLAVKRTILSNAANGKAETSVKVTVLDQNIRTIRLESDAIVTIVNDPISERDVVHVYSVCAIGLLGSCQHFFID